VPVSFLVAAVDDPEIGISFDVGVVEDIPSIDETVGVAGCTGW